MALGLSYSVTLHVQYWYFHAHLFQEEKMDVIKEIIDCD